MNYPTAPPPNTQKCPFLAPIWFRSLYRRLVGAQPLPFVYRILVRDPLFVTRNNPVQKRLFLVTLEQLLGGCKTLIFLVFCQFMGYPSTLPDMLSSLVQNIGDLFEGAVEVLG
jgi:hypothetical protein